LKTAVAEFDKETVDWKKRAIAAEEEVNAIKARKSELEKAIVDNAINSSVSTRERETMLKLIIGVAVEQYGFDPKKSRNDAAKQISDDLAGHGLSVSDDTVRKYLKEAAELLPPLNDRSL
jgi:ribosomal protein L31E